MAYIKWVGNLFEIIMGVAFSESRCVYIAGTVDV